MTIDILTLFPQQVMGWLDHSILKRAQVKKQITIKAWDLREWGLGPHRQVDDTPYGGGAGMVLRADVVVPAIKQIAKRQRVSPRIILLTPQGRRLDQPLVEELARESRLLLVAGHYEGFDERIRTAVDDQISLGDFVLTGGEIAAVALTDAIARLQKGVLDEASPSEESHSLLDEQGTRLLEYPHYTRPESYNGQDVPPVLISGHHANIKKWRQDNTRRPRHRST